MQPFQTPVRQNARVPPMAPSRPSRPSPIRDEEHTAHAARALFHEVHGFQENLRAVEEKTASVNEMKESYFYSVCCSLLFLPHDSIRNWVRYEDFVREYNGDLTTSFKNQIGVWLANHHNKSTMIQIQSFEHACRVDDVRRRAEKIGLFMRAGKSIFGKEIALLHTFPLYESWASTLPKPCPLNRYERMALFMNKYKPLFE